MLRTNLAWWWHMCVQIWTELRPLDNGHAVRSSVRTPLLPQLRKHFLFSKTHRNNTSIDCSGSEKIHIPLSYCLLAPLKFDFLEDADKKSHVPTLANNDTDSFNFLLVCIKMFCTGSFFRFGCCLGVFITMKTSPLKIMPFLLFVGWCSGGRCTLSLARRDITDQTQTPTPACPVHP